MGVCALSAWDMSADIMRGDKLRCDKLRCDKLRWALGHCIRDAAGATKYVTARPGTRTPGRCLYTGGCRVPAEGGRKLWRPVPLESVAWAWGLPPRCACTCVRLLVVRVHVQVQ